MIPPLCLSKVALCYHKSTKPTSTLGYLQFSTSSHYLESILLLRVARLLLSIQCGVTKKCSNNT